MISQVTQSARMCEALYESQSIETQFGGNNIATWPGQPVAVPNVPLPSGDDLTALTIGGDRGFGGNIIGVWPHQISVPDHTFPL